MFLLYYILGNKSPTEDHHDFKSEIIPHHQIILIEKSKVGDLWKTGINYTVAISVPIDSRITFHS